MRQKVEVIEAWMKKEIKTVPDIMIDCPMLKKTIPDAMYCDILAVVDRVAVKSFVPEITDWELAEKMCPGCPVSWLTIDYPD